MLSAQSIPFVILSKAKDLRPSGPDSFQVKVHFLPLPVPSLILVAHDDNGGPPATQTKADRPSPCACCYDADPALSSTTGMSMQPPQRPPLTFRKLLEILATVAVLELGFFLFRLGATWWNQ